MTITHIFDSNSDALNTFVSRYQIGSRLNAWTVSDVEIDTTIPPNPETGKDSTKVTVTLTAH